MLLAVALSAWCEVHRRSHRPTRSSPSAALLVIGLVVVAARLTRRWQRADYRCGAEWLLRMLAG